jgi:hypothetical protein
MRAVGYAVPSCSPIRLVDGQIALRTVSWSIDTTTVWTAAVVGLDQRAAQDLSIPVLGRTKKVMTEKENTTIVNGAGKKAFKRLPGFTRPHWRRVHRDDGVGHWGNFGTGT